MIPAPTTLTIWVLPNAITTAPHTVTTTSTNPCTIVTTTTTATTTATAAATAAVCVHHPSFHLPDTDTITFGVGGDSVALSQRNGRARRRNPAAKHL